MLRNELQQEHAKPQQSRSESLVQQSIQQAQSFLSRVNWNSIQQTVTSCVKACAEVVSTYFRKK